MTGRRLPARLLTLLLIAGCVALPCLTLAGPAWADDGDGAGAHAAEDRPATPAALTHERLDELLQKKPIVAFSLLVVKFLPVLIGVALLIAWYLKRDKIKGGILPPPAPAEPTLTFSAGMAFLLLIVGFGVGPLAFAYLFAGGGDSASLHELPRWLSLLGMALPTVGLAVLVLVQRRRMQSADPEEIRARFGERGAIPTKPPSFGRGFGLGWWTYCVAGVLVLPASFLWALTLVQVGEDPSVQDTVRVVVEDPDQSIPLLIFFFGVFVAPFTEEVAFRGLLYPAIKHGLGGGVNAARWGIVITSAIFAGIHGSLTAAVPLFALALVLNWVFERTNSLAAVIVAHAAHNALSLVPLLMLRYLP